MPKGVLDLGAVYMFIKRLVTPFDQWEAYKQGVIDSEGKVLIKQDERTLEQRQSYGYFDRLVGNLKKLLAKVPGGKTRIASFAAALLLIREENIDADDIEYLEERLDFYFVEARNLLESEVAANVAGSGKIAGIGVGPDGEPGMPPSAWKKWKRQNKSQAKEIAKKVKAKMESNNGREGKII